MDMDIKKILQNVSGVKKSISAHLWYPAESRDYLCFAPLRHYHNTFSRFSFFTALFFPTDDKNLQHDPCSLFAIH